MSANTTQQSTKRCRLDFDTNITVLVGKEAKPFMVYEGIITNHSKFFRAACKGDFKEAKEKLVRLPNVEEEEFKSYLHWIHTTTVVVSAQEKLDEQPDAHGGRRFDQLARLYVVADQLDDRTLRNAVIDALIDTRNVVNRFPGLDTINIAYGQTTQSSSIRRLVSNFFITGGVKLEWVSKYRADLHSDFFFDLASSVFTGAAPSVDPAVDKCHYHEHDEGAPKCC